jgi:hypothetical protein
VVGLLDSSKSGHWGAAWLRKASPLIFVGHDHPHPSDTDAVLLSNSVCGLLGTNQHCGPDQGSTTLAQYGLTLTLLYTVTPGGYCGWLRRGYINLTHLHDQTGQAGRDVTVSLKIGCSLHFLLPLCTQVPG